MFKECEGCPYNGCTVEQQCLADNDSGPENTDEELLLPPDAPCTANFSHDGLCPCCGAVVERGIWDWAQDAMFDECMSCGWESYPFYDL